MKVMATCPRKMMLGPTTRPTPKRCLNKYTGLHTAILRECRAAMRGYN